VKKYIIFIMVVMSPYFLKKKHLSDQCVNKTFDTFNYFSTPTLVETLGKKTRGTSMKVPFGNTTRG
jgi:hypothetical protein